MSVEEKIRELLEATAPGKSGVKAEPMQKIAKNKEDGDMEDTGPAVTDPEQAKGPDASKKVKKAAVPGGEANKGEPSIKPGATKVKAEEVEEDEDKDEIVETAKDDDKEDIKSAVHGKKKKMMAQKDDEEMKEEDDEEEMPDEKSDDDDAKEEDMDDEMKETMKKTKQDIVAMYGKKLMSMNKKDLAASYHNMASGKMPMNAMKHNKEDVDMSADVDALTEGENLSDEYKAKAKTIFESAVNSKLAEKVVELEEHYDNQLAEQTEKVKEDLVEKVDDYLSYIVEQWTKENELAIEKGLKTEITEDFIVSLKKVFEEHYVDVPEDKYDVLTSQQEKIAELEGKLNEEIEKNVNTSKEINEQKKSDMIKEHGSDLAETQKEKFQSLAEGIQYENDDKFAEELKTIKESYFPKVAKPIEDAEVAEENEEKSEVNLSGDMKAYASFISKSTKAN